MSALFHIFCMVIFISAILLSLREGSGKYICQHYQTVHHRHIPFTDFRKEYQIATFQWQITLAPLKLGNTNVLEAIKLDNIIFCRLFVLAVTSLFATSHHTNPTRVPSLVKGMILDYRRMLYWKLLIKFIQAFIPDILLSKPSRKLESSGRFKQVCYIPSHKMLFMASFTILFWQGIIAITLFLN